MADVCMKKAVLLAIDNSPSMGQLMEFLGRLMTRLEGALVCTADMLDFLHRNKSDSFFDFGHAVSINTFNTFFKHECIADDIPQAIWYLYNRVDCATFHPGTGIADACAELRRQAQRIMGGMPSEIHAILITDGEENQRPKEDVLREAALLKNVADSFTVIGFGNSVQEIDADLMRRAASFRQFFFCKDLYALRQVMVQVAVAVRMAKK